jgi:hypothetical protein
MTEPVQVTLHKDESPTGCQLFGYCTKVCGTVQNFTHNFVFGPEYSKSYH